MIIKFKQFLLESINNIDDWYELNFELTRDILHDIINKNKITFKLINKNQYHTALKDFIKHGKIIKFPIKIIYDWKDLVLTNISKLNILNQINGYSDTFPYDEFYDIFDYNDETGEERNGEFSNWLKTNNLENKYHDWGTIFKFLDEVYNIDDYLPTFSNNQIIASDYGLKPLINLGEILIEQENPNDIIVTINKILDVTHQRSDLAELFIEGGSKSLDFITYN